MVLPAVLALTIRCGVDVVVTRHVVWPMWTMYGPHAVRMPILVMQIVSSPSDRPTLSPTRAKPNTHVMQNVLLRSVSETTNIVWPDTLIDTTQPTQRVL